MATPPKLKRSSVRPHNVAEDDDIRHQLFGWKATWYNQRAVLVRVVCKGGKRKMESGIQSVKFIDRDLINQYKYPDEMPQDYSLFSYTGSNVSLDNFYGLLNKCKQFRDFNLDTIWEDIFTIMEHRGYHYTTGHHGGWKSQDWTEELQERHDKLSIDNQESRIHDIDQEYAELKEQKLFLTTFETALKCDMRNGEAKALMTKMVELMKSSTDNPLEIIFTLEPSIHDNTNTEMEVINGDHAEVFEYDDPEESPPKIHRCTVVPDFCVLLPDYPGVFPLVAEMKSANCELQGLTRNIGQMLSKMHFQDIIFGVVITPTAYILSEIRKNGKEELVFQRAMVDLTTVDSTGKLTLNINNFKELCTFVYRVLRWSKVTKCQL